MTKLFRTAAFGAACLALGSCFFAPGKFDSTLELRRDGRFTFAYKGEVLFFDGDDKLSPDGDKCYGPVPTAPPPPPPPPAPVREQLQAAPPPPVIVAPRVVTRPVDDEGQVRAAPQGETARPDTDAMDENAWDERACTPAEKAQRTADRARRKQEQATIMAAVVGFDPDDPQSVRAYIAELKRHPGWREVTHKGGNRFDVDYRLSGTADRDFLFPVFDNVMVHTPFVTLRPRTDGSAELRAPAFGGGGLGMLGALGGGMNAGLRAPGNGGDDPFSRLLKTVDGTFTLVTDGEIRTNNTVDGPAARGGDKVLTWKVTALSKEAPRALVQLR